MSQEVTSQRTSLTKAYITMVKTYHLLAIGLKGDLIVNYHNNHQKTKTNFVLEDFSCAESDTRHLS